MFVGDFGEWEKPGTGAARKTPFIYASNDG